MARDRALSRCAARSGPTSLGADSAIAAAVAGPPGDASRPDRPVPAASGTDIDPSRLRERSTSATAAALSAGALRPRPTPARPCRRHRSTTFRPLPSPARRLPLAGALADVDDAWRPRDEAWRPRDERLTSAGGLLSLPGPPPEYVEARRPHGHFAPTSSSSPAPADVAMKRASHGEDAGVTTRGSTGVRAARCRCAFRGTSLARR